MAIPGTMSALIAAFQFGIVVNAASATLFLNVRGYGSSIFLDGKRLALIIFLLSAALWAQIDFITILIGSAGASSCQLGVIFTTVFDQLARYSIEQHLLWVINAGTEIGAGQYIPQGLLAGRLILGGVFVGFSRHQLDTVCAPVSSILALAIAVVAVDAAAVAILATRAASVGIFKRMKEGGQHSARGKAVFAMLIGLAVWLATSVVMLLGIPTIDYIFRSTVPAGGLIVLISKFVFDRIFLPNPLTEKVIVTASASVLLDTKPRDRERNIPEAPSPRPIETARFITTSDSSDYPPSRYEDLKAEQVISSTAFVQPREVPQPGQGLSNISKPMGGRGVGGVPIQGQLFPPMRSTSAPAKVTKEQPQEKPKNLFKTGSRRQAKAITVGKLSISNPVLQQGGSNPLDKVATVDLRTAAQQERERRARAANPRSAIRSEATAVGWGQTEGFKRATSTIPEEEVIAWASDPALPRDTTLAVGSATGAQLSPSGEDLRRRSPRQAPSMIQGSVPDPNRIPSPPLKSAARGLPQNQYGIVQTNIPQYPTSPPAPEILAPEPAKMALQKRPTNGLPSNPKALSVRNTPSDFEPQRQETVLFVNDIVYNDPNFVAGFMDDTKEQGPKALTQTIPIKTAVPTTPPAATASPETSGSPVSVVNRPRPVPRRSDTAGMDTYFPPIGVPRGHMRSKSAGSLAQRKYILQSGPGSPTTLPPLPPPPQTSDTVPRPKPNDTKSMTFDEKMTLLFPQMQSNDGRQRRSSVPTLPKTPISAMGNSPTLTANNGYDTRSWGSKRTRTSVCSLLEKEQVPQGQDSVSAPQQQMSTEMPQGMFNETDGNTMTDHWSKETKGSKIMKNGKRASSPVLPPRMSFRSATTMDDDTTDWDAGQAPVPVQQLGLAMHQVREPEASKTDKPPSQRTISAMTNQSGEIGIMLDTSVAHVTGPKSTPIKLEEMDSPATEATSTRSSGKWHRRIGEETPRFSSRARRGTPPVPLVLSDRPTLAKQAALVQAAEPSPLPSPEEALQMIQAQLKKYEQPYRGSTESPGQGRLALLKDLEKEMGQQETKWASMQQGLGASRDSLSTFDISPATSSPRTSENDAAVAMVPEESNYLSRNLSNRSNTSIAAARRDSRRARMASLSSARSSSRDMDYLIGGSRASLWQRRLEEAEMEFMEYTNEAARKRSTNFFSVSKADLGSPTPPDSDDSETENEKWRNLSTLLKAQTDKKTSEKTANVLWTPPQAPEIRRGPIWVRPEKPYEQHLPSQDPPLPGPSSRPARRKDTTIPFVGSTSLWQKPIFNTTSSTSGLWKPPGELQKPSEPAKAGPTSSSQSANHYNPEIQRSRTTQGSRPLTQRPPRRSKRITTLPDIVEDPQPLPDKRGTLGIFQFPWGEKSDVASVQSRPAILMSMPGTMSTQAPAMSTARANQQELQDYSSSFFDDFDEEEDESDYSDYAESESDDEGFDESTLWEIATLLQTDDVPSRFSMFPSQVNAMGFMVADYLTQEPEEYDERVARQNIIDSIEEPEGLQEMPSPMPPTKSPKSPKRTQSTLWQATRETDEVLTRNGTGLPQPEDWTVYDQMMEMKRSRSNPMVSSQLAIVDSDRLWMPTPSKMEGSKSPLWTPPIVKESPVPREVSPMPSSHKVVLPTAGLDTPLWKPEKQPARGEHDLGLPHPQDWISYDSVKSTIRANTRPSELAVIESVDMWRRPSEQPGPKNWLQSQRGAATSSLWKFEQPSRRGDHGVGLPQPYDWESYNIIITNVRAKPRLSEPAIIMSPLQLARAFEEQSRKGDYNVGLPHPQDWEKHDNLKATIRAKPRPSKPAVIESVGMWQASQSSTVPGPQNWLLMSKAIAPGSRLWQATKQPQRGEHSVGLPHPQNWESYDNMKMTIRARPRQSEPAVIESIELWQPQSPEISASPSRMWAPKTRSAPVTRAVLSARHTSSSLQQPSKMLWSAPPPKMEAVSEGLFNPQSGRSDFRTTSLAPAAVRMNRKPQSSRVESLDRLTSTTLWIAEDNKDKMEMNWLSVATSVPQTRRRHQLPIQASNMDWEAALQQALAASYPGPQRNMATSSEQLVLALG
ncbi:hypothetical protein VP1G_00836 [Cytospora mali]|uniref:Uncharacterized protein n=1 Tax=Cytospora mali TaxID=578113 RepID=A0A194UP41_CYTMA|nr:hypothetical protein VP1G_00836 [Valsa mali var. pyri (nom. inval.)]